MSIWTRLASIVRGDRLHREIEEELSSHIEESITQGRDPAEAQRAFGSSTRRREESQAKPTGVAMLALPSLTILAAALLAALPAVIRAVRIDPVTMLRNE